MATLDASSLPPLQLRAIRDVTCRPSRRCGGVPLALRSGRAHVYGAPRGWAFVLFFGFVLLCICLRVRVKRRIPPPPPSRADG